jgi:hypothetical protein
MFTVSLTADDLWNNFTTILNCAIQLFVPIITVQGSSSGNPKFKKYPRYIRNMLTCKRCLWRILRRDRTNLELELRYRCISR